MMRRVDLLPARYEARKREKRTVGIIVVAALLALLMLLAYWFLLGTQISSEKNRLATAQSTNLGLQSQIDELQKFALLEAELQQKRTALQTVFVGDVNWPSLLTEIAMVIPGEVWLTSMNGSAAAAEGGSPVGTETAAIRISNEAPTGRILFTGSALTLPGVAKWLIRQGTADAFSAVWLNSAITTEATPDQQGSTQFDSTLELSSEALSQRFQRDLP